MTKVHKVPNGNVDDDGKSGPAQYTKEEKRQIKEQIKNATHAGG